MILTTTEDLTLLIPQAKDLSALCGLLPLFGDKYLKACMIRSSKPVLNIIIPWTQYFSELVV